MPIGAHKNTDNGFGFSTLMLIPAPTCTQSHIEHHAILFNTSALYLLDFWFSQYADWLVGFCEYDSYNPTYISIQNNNNYTIFHMLL